MYGKTASGLYEVTSVNSRAVWPKMDIKGVPDVSGYLRPKNLDGYGYRSLGLAILNQALTDEELHTKGMSRFYVEARPEMHETYKGTYEVYSGPNGGKLKYIVVYEADSSAYSIITLCHELAHHMMYVLHGEMGHLGGFHECYYRLLKASCNMGIITPCDVFAVTDELTIAYPQQKLEEYVETDEWDSRYCKIINKKIELLEKDEKWALEHPGEKKREKKNDMYFLYRPVIR